MFCSKACVYQTDIVILQEALVHAHKYAWSTVRKFDSSLTCMFTGVSLFSDLTKWTYSDEKAATINDALYLLNVF